MLIADNSYYYYVNFTSNLVGEEVVVDITSIDLFDYEEKKDTFTLAYDIDGLWDLLIENEYSYADTNSLTFSEEEGVKKITLNETTSNIYDSYSVSINDDGNYVLTNKSSSNETITLVLENDKIEVIEVSDGEEVLEYALVVENPGGEGEGQGGEGEGQGGEGEGQGGEGEGQGSEGEGQGSEGEGQGSEGEGQGSEGEGQGSEGEGQGSEGEGQGSEKEPENNNDKKSNKKKKCGKKSLELVISLISLTTVLSFVLRKRH